CERGALQAAAVGEQLLASVLEEVEVREPERRRDHEAEHGCDDHAGAESDASLPEADGDQGLADCDDHDQPVTLDEVRRLDPPAADPAEQRSEEADDDGGRPQHRLGPSVDEPGGDDQCRAGERRRSDPQDRRQEVSVTPCCERVEREMHDGDDGEENPEDDTVTAERVRDRQRGDEHRPHRNQHRCPHGTQSGIDGVGQPCVGSPSPPERGEDQQTVAEATPGRIVREDGGDLREPENEDEVEEELERGDRVLALDGVRFDHSGTLPHLFAVFAPVCNNELNGSVSSDGRPRLRGPRRSEPACRARTARRRQRDDQRARRALRHVVDRDEEAHPAARGGAPRHNGEGRPCPQMHARALCLRRHQHVAAAAQPLCASRRTYVRRQMSPTTKKKGGFTAEEKAAMRARAKELKATEDGETAVQEALAKMTPKDRALGKRIHAIVRERAPDLTPKTWYGMPAYANKDGKVVVFFRDAAKFKERYAMLGFNDTANLDGGNMWPVAFALTELTAADEKKIATLVKKAVG